MKARLATLPVIALLTAALCWFAVSRLDFDADTLRLLPQDLPEVAGLRLYEKHFGQEYDLMITLEAEDPDALEASAESLAARLEADKSLVSSAEWQAPQPDDLVPFAELCAYIWSNLPPRELAALAQRLSPPVSAQRFADAMDTLGGSLDSEELFRASQDPLGVAEFPGMDRGWNEDSDSWGFSSKDGTFRLIYLDAPADLYDYQTTVQWLETIHASIAAWRVEEKIPPAALIIDATGRAPFIVEISAAMENDLRYSVSITVIVILLLFWLFYRRWMPLLWLVVCLAVTFAITLAIGSLVFAELSSMSVGFAAILVGLAVDYGFILYQESLTGGLAPRELRRRLLYSISWASITTACVFFGLNLSSLPGARQLGSMVAIGIITGAVIMLALFPWLDAASPRPRTQSAPREWSSRQLANLETFVLLLVSVVALAAFRFPGIATDQDSLRQKHIHARDVIESVAKKLSPEKDRRLAVVLQADSNAAMQSLLVAAGEMADSSVPAPLWPNQSNQTDNLPKLAALADSSDRLRREADDAGLSEEAIAFALAVLDHWKRFAAEPDRPVYPGGETARWVLDKTIHRGTDTKLVLGTVNLPEIPDGGDHDEQVRSEEPLITALVEKGIYPASWSHLRPGIMRLIRHELFSVVIPMAVTLFVMLVLVFRRFTGAFLSVATLAFSSLVLLAVMSLFGIEWSLLNIAAIPLLLGAGLDYSIHMQFALRRANGDVAASQSSTGRALVLCALSTATGFGTLTWSSNAGLSSLGLICALGILINVGTAVLLLPWWQRRLEARHIRSQFGL